MVSKSKQKREMIFKSIVISIAKHGLNVPMSIIVKESNFSTGVFYHYFSSKEVMINDLYKKLKYDFLDATLSDFSNKTSYFDQFKNIWLNSLNFLVDNPDILKLFFQFENASHLVPELEEIHKEKIGLFINFIQTGIKQGIVKDLPLILISDLSIGVTMQTAKNSSNGVIKLNDKLAGQILLASWDSIKA